ncbi:MAG TPA: VCBS repeat-containing protein [Blastocatellia bacterium]|jgi:hypothetical protein
MKSVLAALTLIAAVQFASVQTAHQAASPALRQPAFTAVQGSPIRVGPMAGEPAVGDCNGDGNLDIVLACGTCCGSQPSPESGHVVVLAGDGRGGFTPAKGSPIKVAPSARKIALGDVNRDRRLDILVAQHDSYDITVLLGDGRGQFTTAPASPVAAASGPRAHTHDITTADVNGDGNLDVLTTNANDNSISILLGDGTGRFSPAEGSPVRAGRHPYDVVSINDVNADGKLDLITPNIHANGVTVMLGDGRGRFAASNGSPFPLGPRPGYVAVEDVNGDGKLDIVATHDDDPLVAVLFGDGRGGFQPAPYSPLRTPHTVWGTALADMNRDGRKDIVLASPLGHGLLVMLGDGKGGFEPAASGLIPAGKLTNYVALGDFNNDGRPDIVASNYASGDVAVFLNSTR